MSRGATWSDLPTTRRAGLAVVELPGEGTPVVLVPGFTGSKEDFGPVLPLLAAAGRHVLAVDQPGQHESPGPDDAAGYTTGDQAAAVAAVVADLGGRAHLVGHSFGGLVCRALAIARPEAVASLVLLCSGPAAVPAARGIDTELLLGGASAPGVTMAQVWQAATAHWRRLGAEEPSDFAARRWLASTLPGLVGTARAILHEPDRTDELAGTGVPVLVMTGERDDAWPPALQAEMAGRLGTRQVVLRGAAHSPAVEEPERTAAALLDWLRETAT